LASLTILQVSDELMERNANAFMTQKLAAGWLAMRLDVM
jgi:ATP-binding cassette subfamily C (CFTR/MRP) protein 1